MIYHDLPTKNSDFLVRKLFVYQRLPPHRTLGCWSPWRSFVAPQRGQGVTPEPEVACTQKPQQIMRATLPSGKHTKNYGKSPLLMGKSTISMAMFNSYIKLPEGKLL
jgi:hypothetical protein